jgi:hypothetical protein
LPLANAMALLAIVIGGYILGRLQEALFLWKFGIQMHIWRPIDSRFRLITARRNPNLLILTLFTIAGRPDLGMLAVAAWTCVSLVFHSVRIIQAFRVRGTGRLTSWLATAP